MMHDRITQLCRLCLLVDNEDGVIFSGVGPCVEVFPLISENEMGTKAILNVFCHSGVHVRGMKGIDGTDNFVIYGSSLFAIASKEELINGGTVNSSRIHSLHDEIADIAYGKGNKSTNEIELGIVLRSGMTLQCCIIMSENGKESMSTQNVVRPGCGILMSVLCTGNDWKSLRCLAGPAMGKVFEWTTNGTVRTEETLGTIGFVIHMHIAKEENGEITVVAVTENRAVNLWRIGEKGVIVLDCAAGVHSVRPCCVTTGEVNGMEMGVSASEDGELLFWSIQSQSLNLIQRFHTNCGAVRSFSLSHQQLFYGTATGSLVGLQVLNFMESQRKCVIKGKDDIPSIRCFVVRRKQREGMTDSEFVCVGEDGSLFRLLNSNGKIISERLEGYGQFSHVFSTDDYESQYSSILAHGDRGVVVVTGDEKVSIWKMEWKRSRLVSVRMVKEKEMEDEEERFLLAVQLHTKNIMIIRLIFSHSSRCPRVVLLTHLCVSLHSDCRYLLINSFAVHSSFPPLNGKRRMGLVIGTSSGRILWSIVTDDVTEVMNVVGTEPLWDDIAHGIITNATIGVYKPSPSCSFLHRSPITRLSFSTFHQYCTGLSKSGTLFHVLFIPKEKDEWRVEVREERLNRQVGIEWPIEYREERQVVVGFNERHLIVGCRRSGERLMSVECGGGHRSVDVQMDNNSFIVHYVTNGTLIRVIHISYHIGRRQLAWSPHRDKIVSCKGIKMKNQNVILSASIDGEICTVNESSPPIARWYLPEVASCSVTSFHNGFVVALGGSKGEVFVSDVNDGSVCDQRPQMYSLGIKNNSKVLSICLLSSSNPILCGAVFADANVVIYRLHKSEQEWKGEVMAEFEMGKDKKCIFSKIVMRKIGDCVDVISVSSGGFINVWGLCKDHTTMKHESLVERSALTALNLLSDDNSSGDSLSTLFIGTDSGSIVVYGESYMRLCEWRNAHGAQVTDISSLILHSSIFISSVAMDCSLVLFSFSNNELFILRGILFAVDDPSSLLLMKREDIQRSDEERQLVAVVAGCGMQNIII